MEINRNLGYLYDGERIKLTDSISKIFHTNAQKLVDIYLLLFQKGFGYYYCFYGVEIDGNPYLSFLSKGISTIIILFNFVIVLS